MHPKQVSLTANSHRSESDHSVINQKFDFSLSNSFTDSEVLDREAEAIIIDDLNVAQIKEIRDKVIIPFGTRVSVNIQWVDCGT